MTNLDTDSRAQNHLANRLAAFWPSGHALGMTEALAIVAKKDPAAFGDAASCQRETDAVTVISDALAKLGQPGILDGQEVGGTRNFPQRHRLHLAVSTAHRPRYWGENLNLA